MVRLTKKRIEEIAASLANIPSRELFLKESRSVFLMLGDEASGNFFRQKFTEALKKKWWRPKLSEEILIELAQRFNDPPLTMAICGRISEQARQNYFPEMVEAGSAGGAVGTTTANTAPFAIPLGSESPSKKKNRKKKKR